MIQCIHCLVGQSKTSLICKDCICEVLGNKLLRSRYDRTWHRKICEQDNYTCYSCGVNFEDQQNMLCGDHILPKSSSPKKRYDLKNGRAVCNSFRNLCHTRRHAKGGQKLHCITPGCPFTPTESGYCYRCKYTDFTE